MVERSDRSGVATFFQGGPFAAAESVALVGGALQHALVRRVQAGDAVRLVDGMGTVASGAVVSAAKSCVRIVIEAVDIIARPVALVQTRPTPGGARTGVALRCGRRSVRAHPVARFFRTLLPLARWRLADRMARR